MVYGLSMARGWFGSVECIVTWLICNINDISNQTNVEKCSWIAQNIHFSHSKSIYNVQIVSKSIQIAYTLFFSKSSLIYLFFNFGAYAHPLAYLSARCNFKIIARIRQSMMARKQCMQMSGELALLLLAKGAHQIDTTASTQNHIRFRCMLGYHLTG